MILRGEDMSNDAFIEVLKRRVLFAPTAVIIIGDLAITAKQDEHGNPVAMELPLSDEDMTFLAEHFDKK